MPATPARTRSGQFVAHQPAPEAALRDGFLALVFAMEAQAQEDIPRLGSLADCRRWYSSNPQLAWMHLVHCLETHLGYLIAPR